MATTKKAYSTDWAPVEKATAGAIKKFEDKFLKEMGIDLSELNDDYEVVSTGSLNLDYATGVGGVPTGRIVEFWGPEHSGKTTICLLMAGEFQRKFPDKKVAWVDMEQTFDPAWATKLGVDVKALWRPPVKTAEDTADATKRFVESGLCSLVVLDSVGGMIAKMEFQKEADEATVALVAKIVTRMVKQCSPMAKSNGTTVAVVNQVRDNIGSYGVSQTTTGGWALRHVTSMRFNVKKAGSVLPHTITVDGDSIPVGHCIAVKVEKNKLAPYGQIANIWLHNRETDKYGPVGVDKYQETFDFAKRLNMMGTKGGGWYTMPNGEELRGEDVVINHLRSNEEDLLTLRGQILTSLAAVTSEEEFEDLGLDDSE